MTVANKIQLTDNTIENLKLMAPKLTERQQNIVLGLFFGFMVQNEKVGDMKIDSLEAGKASA
ncbi:MAG: hypothetical protein HFG42_11100 [Lachnospiraceae bacterium]|nr:hypothetical protein [Lachnospiraceae bacterium]